MKNSNASEIFELYEEYSDVVGEYKMLFGKSKEIEDIPYVIIEFRSVEMKPDIMIKWRDNTMFYGDLCSHPIDGGIEELTKIINEYKEKLVKEKETFRIGEEICFNDSFYGVVLCIDNGMITYLDQVTKTINHAFISDYEIEKTGRRFLDDFLETEEEGD